MSSQSPRTLSYAEALSAMLAKAAPLADESVPLEHALGRALAGAVSSDIDLPPWDNAGMDGYAARREDVRGRRPRFLFETFVRRWT